MGIIRIIKNNPIEKKYMLVFNPWKCDYEFTIELGINEEISEKTIKDNMKQILDDINTYREEIKDFETEEFIDTLNFLDEIKGSEYDYIVNAEYLETDYSNEELNDLINRNDFLKNKRLVIDDATNTNYQTLKNLEEVFKDNVSLIAFTLEGNTEFVDYDTCKKTLELINNITSNVIQYDFSPFEQVMYVYDCVRNRIYKREDENQDYEDSRDLSNILLGDKIVCLGFANVMQKILNELQIRNVICSLIRTDNSRIGHARNVIYLVDKKYGIEGIYSLDATWDSRRYENDNSFYNDYSHFCLTSEQIKK